MQHHGSERGIILHQENPLLELTGHHARRFDTCVMDRHAPIVADEGYVCVSNSGSNDTQLETHL